MKSSQPLIDKMLSEGRHEDVLVGLKSTAGLVRLNGIVASVKHQVKGEDVKKVLESLIDSGIKWYQFTEGEFAIAALFLLGYSINENLKSENVQIIIENQFKMFGI